MHQNNSDESAGLCDLDSLRGILDNLKGRRVTLVGLGQFGVGEGAADFLASHEADLTVTDLKPMEELSAVVERLGHDNITYHLGSHSMSDVENADLVVANPAVPRDAPILKSAEQAGVPITSPMNMFLALCPAPIVGVTGSNGKSTTTSMVGAMVKRTGHRTWVGGNIGRSLLPNLDEISADDRVVLELSSFQLQDTAALQWSPHVSVVTNLSLNHLDRHGTFQNYVAAKKNIGAFQSEDDALILNASDPRVAEWANEDWGGETLFFDARSNTGEPVVGMSLRFNKMVWHRSDLFEVVCSRHAIPLAGQHNVENALAAAAAARCIGVRSSHIMAALRNFKALEHRIQFLGEIDGVSLYDDSLSTTPESTIAALRSMRRPVTLIAGGYDKELPLEPMAEAVAEVAEVLVTIGETGPVLARKTREAGARGGMAPPVREAHTLEEALEAAMDLSMPGSVVLFSPGCASYDMFDNCVERGNIFQKLVEQYAADAASPGMSA